jgi:hypothetical protein
MPGGNLNQQQQQTDLRGFLGRRRATLQQWMEANNIIDAEGLGRLISDSKWYADPELLSEAQSLLKKPTEPSTAIPVLVVVDEQKNVAAASEEVVEEEKVVSAVIPAKRKKGV